MLFLSCFWDWKGRKQTPSKPLKSWGFYLVMIEKQNCRSSSLRVMYKHFINGVNYVMLKIVLTKLYDWSKTKVVLNSHFIGLSDLQKQSTSAIFIQLSLRGFLRFSFSLVSSNTFPFLSAAVPVAVCYVVTFSRPVWFRLWNWSWHCHADKEKDKQKFFEHFLLSWMVSCYPIVNQCLTDDRTW